MFNVTMASAQTLIHSNQTTIHYQHVHLKASHV